MISTTITIFSKQGIRANFPSWDRIYNCIQFHGQRKEQYFAEKLHRLPTWLGKREWNNLSRLMTEPTKWHVRPAKTQISLGIRPVWSESSLSAWRKFGSSTTHWAHSDDWSDWADAEAELSLRWAHSHIVGFVTRWLSLRLSIRSVYRNNSVYNLVE